MKVYDAENQILGRLSSKIAKELLNGENVIVVNAEKAVLSGRPKQQIGHYDERVKRGDPFHGPFFPRYPNEIFRRTVRGMIPWHSYKGRTAFKKLKVYVGIPEEYTEKPKEKMQSADAARLKTNYITVGDLSISIGAKKKW